MNKGLLDEHILEKYQDLTLERLEMAKKRWELNNTRKQLLPIDQAAKTGMQTSAE